MKGFSYQFLKNLNSNGVYVLSTPFFTLGPKEYSSVLTWGGGAGASSGHLSLSCMEGPISPQLPIQSWRCTFIIHFHQTSSMLHVAECSCEQEQKLVGLAASRNRMLSAGGKNHTTISDETEQRSNSRESVTQPTQL